MNLEAAWNTYCKIPLPWVRTLGPNYWRTQRNGDLHGADKYKHLQPESYALLEAVMQLASRRKQPLILDLGCNRGRHMLALYRRGFRYVEGLDVMAKQATIRGSFVDLLPVMPDRIYNVVFTFGMTIELVPPSFPICHHIARITSDGVVLAVHEVHAPYPRLWRREFEREGFDLTRYEAPIVPKSQLSLFVFERQL